MNKLVQIVKQVAAIVVDIKRNPAKYRKAAAVPAGVVVYLVSIQFGADSSITLEVVAALTALGVIGVANKTA